MLRFVFLTLALSLPSILSLETEVSMRDDWEGQEYCDLRRGSRHTMCKYHGPDPDCQAKTLIRELSEEAKQVILDKHNELRRKIAKGEEERGVGGPQPPASNMRELRWNDELASIAQRWTDQCVWGHDKDRRKLDGTWAGQNGFAAGGWTEETREEVESRFGNAITAFYNEVRFWPSAQISPFKWLYKAGHYTQVVWADTEEVGCGMTYFPAKNRQGKDMFKTLLFCNYAVAGNRPRKAMYLVGEACSECPQGYTCNDGLCVAP